MFTLRNSEGVGWPLGSRPVFIGRGQANDVQIADETVSSRHAAAWADGSRVWVRDLGSRNGTRLNGEPILGTVAADLGDVIEVGPVRLRVESGPGRSEAFDALVLEHLRSGLRTAFLGERLRLGEGPGVDVELPGVAEAVLLRLARDEIALGQDDDMTALSLGTPFLLGPHELVLLSDRPEAHATREARDDRARVRLRATLEGGPGPRAWISDARGRVLEVAAENRATLLWTLGRRAREDLAAGTEPGRAGWMPETEAITAVWGRGAGATAANLRVLLCRIRRDLREQGLDPWTVEHRAGHLRIRADQVEIE